MKRRLTITLFMILSYWFVTSSADYDPAPPWAIPKRGSEWKGKDVNAKIKVPGSQLELTQDQIDDPFNAPDWFPGEHEPMPDIVKLGKKPDIQACVMCHLASGNGHPQSAKLTGLSAEYILDQLEAFKTGDRKSYVGPFIDNLHAISDRSDAVEAAEWFTSLKPVPHQEVIETNTVPETHFDSRYMRLVKEPSDGTIKHEPIDGRIIETPKDAHRVKARDPQAMFITYVPKGSLRKGKEIATTGGGKVAPCVSCHGPHLEGSPIAPALAGAFPTYTIRQLYDFRNGRRTGLADKNGTMSAMAKQLSAEDITNVSAYIGSLRP